MLSLKVLSILILILLLVTLSTAQNPPQSGEAQEFPVLLQQPITAGKTPLGTKVQAKLTIATLVNGKVIPRNAVLAGEVVESVPKTKKDPSRLSVRIDSATWKDGSMPLKLFMQPWYYPSVVQSGEDLQYGPPDAANRNWNYGQGEYPNPNSPGYKPFPGTDSNKDQGVPNATNSVTSKHRVPMKDVEVQHGQQDAVILVSKRSTFKLDRLTTYVFAASDLPLAK
ncbi:MAG TPA: hypothetical protein VGS27_07715 [Candidatus Sulfotelmatobacter sp.]|nr:hypothetical protein [Candidatus Sulfotelmatobacter sp.]